MLGIDLFSVFTKLAQIPYILSLLSPTLVNNNNNYLEAKGEDPTG